MLVPLEQKFTVKTRIVRTFFNSNKFQILLRVRITESWLYFTNCCWVLGCGALVTYFVELSFLVSKSAHLSYNSRRLIFNGYLRVGCKIKNWDNKWAKIKNLLNLFNKSFITFMFVEAMIYKMNLVWPDYTLSYCN